MRFLARGLFSDLQLCLIIFLLVTQGANGLPDVDPITCGQLTPGVEAALREAVDMAENGFQQQSAFQRGTLTPNAMRVTMYTFKAYWTRLDETPVPGLVDQGAALAGRGLLGEQFFFR